jgi:hypothetical protein
VDCWDGKDGEPIVTHGYTRCSKIPFKSVLETIREVAFIKSDYPMIISLEVHCSIPQQIKMAQYLKQTFGDQLLYYEQEIGKSLPSPEEAKGKIILQGELAQPNYKMKQVSYDVLTDLFSAEQELQVDAVLKQADKMIETMKDVMEDPEDRIGRWSIELYNLIMFRALPYDQREEEFKLSQHRFSHFAMLNMSEGFAHAKIRANPDIFVDHNTHRLTRVYPKATRLFSSNFNPQFYWLHGCQCAAMNYQRQDAGMRIHSGVFTKHDQLKRNGYILKPQYDTSNNQLDSSQISIIKFLPNYQCSEWKRIGRLYDVTCKVEVTSNSTPWKLKTTSLKLSEQLQYRKDHVVDVQYYKDLNRIPVISFGIFKKRRYLEKLVPHVERHICLAYAAFPTADLNSGYHYIPIIDKNNNNYGAFLVHVNHQ